MRTFGQKVFSWLVGAALLYHIAVPSRLLADDRDGKSAPATPTSAKPAKPDAPAPMTERERMLLDRVEQLEKRMAELEAKQPAGASPAAAAGPVESMSAATAAPNANAAAVNVASPSLTNLAKGADGVAPGKGPAASPEQ